MYRRFAWNHDKGQTGRIFGRWKKKFIAFRGMKKLHSILRPLASTFSLTAGAVIAKLSDVKF